MESKERRYYRAMHKAVAAITRVDDTGALLGTLAENTAEAMNAKACSIMLLSPDRRRLQHSASYGLSKKYLTKGPISVDESTSEALQGRPVTIHDAGTDPRLQYAQQAAEEGIVSILTVPIRLHEEVIGVLRCYMSEATEFEDEDTEFMQALADLGALALEKAHRYDSIKRSYDSMCQDLLDWYGAGQKPISWFRY